MPRNHPVPVRPRLVAPILPALRRARCRGVLRLVFALFLGVAAAARANAAGTPNAGEQITVVPRPFEGALRNPLMGITARERGLHEWGTLTHHYIGWRELERVESDGVGKIIEFCNAAWREFPAKNVKVIPRVYLRYPGREDAWPEDLAAGDFTSAAFGRRLERFLAKLGQAWDGDSRVAFVELGIFGKWGEHHSPEPTEEIQRQTAAAIAQAFPHKLVSVRRAWDMFPGYPFGEYWDSFAHWDEMATNGRPLAEWSRATRAYERNYIGGEVAYDWGNWQIQPGVSPTASLAEAKHLAYVLNTVRWVHCTQLRWIGDYDRDDPRAVEGAARLQRALGYRFVLDRVSYTASLAADGRLSLDVVVRNVGSAPFYYRWPVEVSLLDPRSREVVWRHVLADVDIRTWQPGRSVIAPTWSTTPGDEFARASWPDHEVANWSEPAAAGSVRGVFTVSIPPGRYVLALAILDPAGQRPAVSFATAQYWRGARHPIGLVGVGGAAGGPLPDDTAFDDPFSDQTLRYEPEATTPPPVVSEEK